MIDFGVKLNFTIFHLKIVQISRFFGNPVTSTKNLKYFFMVLYLSFIINLYIIQKKIDE